jgi:hypothetical protein
MAQQIINTGTGPDTGDGDDLYVAFTKVNQNFSSLWQYGPVDSNITIGNNTISTTNTNGNLILNPQGIGVVQVNNNILPRFHNSFSLGTNDLRFRSAYFGTGGVEISGNLTLNGTFFGNISFGNTIAANLDGNVLTSNGQVILNNSTKVLDVDTAYVGSLLQTGNILPLANNTYTLGNSALQWAEIWVAGNTIYIDNIALTTQDGQLFWSGQQVLTTAIGNDLVLSGNVTANIITANISLESAQANITGNLSAGNVLTDALLYANGAPYVFNEVPGGANGALQFNSNGAFGGSNSLVWDAATSNLLVSGNVDASQTITAAAFVGDGSGLSNLNIGAVLANGTSSVSIPQAGGNIVMTVGSVDIISVSSGGADLQGNLVVSGNITGNLFVGDGRALTRIMAQRGSDPDNWNTLTEMGVYKVNRTSWSGTTGTPLDSNVFKGLLQVASETDGVTQIFFPGTVTATNVRLQWARNYLDGVWTNWYKIVNDDQTLEGGSF